MISFGTNITSTIEPLRKFHVEQVYHSIQSPRPEIQNQIAHLRVVRSIDEKKYKSLKRMLPYIVCSIFNPPLRHSDNFSYTEYFIIDIDNLNEKGKQLVDIKRTMMADSRVVMCFVSPSEDGLKVMFHLSERCYDKGLYAIFYKRFASAFSRQYQLEQVVDAVTCDVSRACFVSYDPEVYYNVAADTISLNDFVKDDDTLFSVRKETDVAALNSKKESFPNSSDSGHEPDDEALDRIKNVLGVLRRRKKDKPMPYVPQVLDDIVPALVNEIEKTGLQITEISNIQYGKRIRLELCNRKAEVNLYYGKRGFSVVETPRAGTNAELNATAAELISGLAETISSGNVDLSY